MKQLGIVGSAALRSVAEVIATDEDFAVEFKSIARWDVREAKPNKAMEDAIVKTVAGFLNTDGGTLPIGDAYIANRWEDDATSRAVRRNASEIVFSWSPKRPILPL